MFVKYELSCDRWFTFFHFSELWWWGCKQCWQVIPTGICSWGLSWWNPPVHAQSIHTDLTGTDLCSPILLATLHSLWEKLNPAGEGQVNIWQTDSQFKEKLSG